MVHRRRQPWWKWPPIGVLGPLRAYPGREILVSLVVALSGFAVVAGLNEWLLHPHSSVFLLASMGSSAALLFAAPHLPFSQPWPVLAGHLVSAVIGVACWKFFGDAWWAAPLAVAGSIAAMQLLRCLHPPASATVLVPLLGGAEVHALGYGFVAAPVLINVLLLLAVAVVVNYPFPSRRYPLALAPAPAVHAPQRPVRVRREDLVFALNHLETMVDIGEQDLLALHARAAAHAARHARQTDSPD